MFWYLLPISLSHYFGHSLYSQGKVDLDVGIGTHITIVSQGKVDERGYEKERLPMWRLGGHGLNPLHSTMASSEIRDIYGVIERWEIGFEPKM